MRFVFFGGKGGVGKTTCAAAAAVRAAEGGARVLVVSTDPAHSLGDALGLELAADARRVKDTKDAKDTKDVKDVKAGECWAAELDADRALTRWLREREQAIRTIAERGTYFDQEDVDRFLSLSFPGVDELVGLIELVRLSRAKTYDQVVVDTAPTGHTLRLLEMPDTLKRLGEVLDQMHAKHRFLASSLGGAWRGDFADDAIAEIEREAAELRELLVDPARCAFTWVTLAEELPVLEAEDGVRALEEHGVHVDVVVVNRVWPEPDRKCALCTPRFEDELEWKISVANVFPDKSLLEVPAAETEPQGPAGLLALAQAVRPLVVEKVKSKRGRATLVDDEPTVAMGAAALSPIAETVRLALFGGKGGVGKTTIAAASALELAAARSRERVLLLSTDPAHSLGDVFGVELGDEARRVAKAPRNLVVRELDAAKAWAAERERYRAAIGDLFDAVFRGAMDASYDRAVLEDLLDLAPPGIDELFAIVSLLDALLAEPRRYDLVVVDTAPTGHTLRLLSLPEKALAWVHALMSVILKYRSVVGLGDFASDLTALAKRLRALIALLADPVQCAFILVTRPAALPRLETERAAKELRRLKVPIAAVVANAVTAPSCKRCTAAAESERPEIDRLERLAFRAARLPRLITAPAIYPGPHGVRELRLFRDTWLERGPRA
ncbi:MAG: TRC40/GET3/ArsA family transport-energizing ATPase [Labilithrix sp.]|nr:TRC40/GET3/ArsA family transport-energizing ATPase [Labilithrix sp.]